MFTNIFENTKAGAQIKIKNDGTWTIWFTGDARGRLTDWKTYIQGGEGEGFWSGSVGHWISYGYAKKTIPVLKASMVEFSYSMSWGASGGGSYPYNYCMLWDSVKIDTVNGTITISYKNGSSWTSLKTLSRSGTSITISGSAKKLKVTSGANSEVVTIPTLTGLTDNIEFMARGGMIVIEGDMAASSSIRLPSIIEQTLF